VGCPGRPAAWPPRPRERLPDEQAPRPAAPGEAVQCRQPRRCRRGGLLARAALRLLPTRGDRCARGFGRAQARGAPIGAGCAGSCWSVCWTTARWSCSRSWRSTPRGCGAPGLTQKTATKEALPGQRSGSEQRKEHPQRASEARRAHARAAALSSHSLKPDLAAPPPARRQAPLKAEAPLLLEVWDAVLAGLDAAALLAAPAACFREPSGARRAAQPQPGLMQEARAALDRELRAAAALKQARPAPPAPSLHRRGDRLRKGVARCTTSGLHIRAPRCACTAGRRLTADRSARLVPF